MVTWNRLVYGLAAFKKNKQLANYLHLLHICSKKDQITYYISNKLNGKI